MAHITGMYRAKSDAMYMKTVYPVLRQVQENDEKPFLDHINFFDVYLNFEVQYCSMFSLLFLHVFLYGCNIVMWRKTRINYSFIFELSQTKELKHSDVFLICTASMAAIIGVLFLHLSLVAKGYSYAQVQAIPGLLLLVTSRTHHDHKHKQHEKKKFHFSTNERIISSSAGLHFSTSLPLQHNLQIE